MVIYGKGNQVKSKVAALIIWRCFLFRKERKVCVCENLD